MTIRALRNAPLLLLCMASCKKDGGTPGFVRLTEPVVYSADGTDEVGSSVTDLWVYANDEPVGVWQPDRRIPILAEGPTTLKVIAGVRRNGISDDRIQYPFYATSTQEVVLAPGEEISLQPVFEYFEDHALYEGFESQGSAFDFTAGDTAFYPIDGDVAGEHAGEVVLDPGHASFTAVSIAAPAFQNGTNPAFLEIDYRSDTRFLVGGQFELGGQLYTVPYIYVSPTKQADGSMPWRHVYIDLGAVWTTGATVERQFYLHASLEDGATSARIIMDNIRVVY